MSLKYANGNKPLTQEQKDIIVKSLQNDNIVEYKGKISLPV